MYGAVNMLNNHFSESPENPYVILDCKYQARIKYLSSIRIKYIK